MKNYLHVIIVLCVVITIQACSFKYLYNQLDWLVVSYIEDYISLDDEQSELLSKKLEKSFEWHRDTQLSLYSQWLQKFHDDLESGVDRSTVLNHFDTVISFFTNILVTMTDDIYVLLPTLTEAQIKELLYNLSTHNEDFADEFRDQSNAELIKQERDNLIEKYDDWLGDLTKQQTALIIKASGKTKFVFEERYLARLKWQRLLSKILYQAKSGKDVKQDFKNLFNDFKQFRDKATSKKFNDKKIASAELIVAISKTVTKKQKLHLFEKIENYKVLFKELME